MRFAYTTFPNQGQLDSMPRLPLTLKSGNTILNVTGLIDSGATVNVLPFSIGQQLGSVWDSKKAIIRLAGNMDKSLAQPIVLKAKIAQFPEVTLAFAWVSHDDIPIILGQTNFFTEFDICFFRKTFEFEIKPK